MCSAMTVARPVGVIPTTRPPSQRKCSLHGSRRGSNNTTSSPVCGSTLTKRAPFLSEHETQASARFSEVDCPPATTGTTWSTWKVASWPVRARPQYSQQFAARSITWCRRLAGTTIILPASRTHPLRPQPQERQQLRQINQPLGLVPLRIS
jgi:hypothetical protein